MIEGIGIFLIMVALVDFTIRFARLVKPLRKMSEKLAEESQRIRFEVARIAEEVSAIRKDLQKDSAVQNTDQEI